jgi:hypothetical protein
MHDDNWHKRGIFAPVKKTQRCGSGVEVLSSPSMSFHALEGRARLLEDSAFSRVLDGPADQVVFLGMKEKYMHDWRL